MFELMLMIFIYSIGIRGIQLLCIYSSNTFTYIGYFFIMFLLALFTTFLTDNKNKILTVLLIITIRI